MRRPRPCIGAAFVLLTTAGAAHGADETDTSYGRIESDVSASVGLGVALGPSAPRASADLRLRYLWTAGLFATYEDGPLLGGASDPRRVFATGVELRPLFLARWLQGLETGNAYIDLAIDSFGLELGAVFEEPIGRPFGSRPGLQAGVGLELPILPSATGPVIGLHGGARWSDATLAGRTIEGPSDRALYLLVTIAWQHAFKTHVVNLGDPEPR